MKKVKNQPISGAQPEYGNKARPLVPNAKDTSLDAQKSITSAPMPFKAKNQVATTPTGTGASGGISTLEPRVASGMQHSNPGARALPQGGAVGQNRMPNQSGQVFGRMGISHPRRVGQQNLSKVKKGAAFYGE